MSLDLEAIKARSEAATPGPWPVAYRGSEGDHPGVASSIGPFSPDHNHWDGWHLGGEPADADFVSHAREDVPALVAMALNQQAVLLEVQEWLNEGAPAGWQDDIRRRVVSVLGELAWQPNK